MTTVVTAAHDAFNLEAAITAAYETREAARQREREDQERRQCERETREVYQFWTALTGEEEQTFWNHLDITVEFMPQRTGDDFYQARASFGRYKERFSLRFHGQNGWTLSCPSRYLDGQFIDDREWPDDLVIECGELVPRLLAYLGDVRHHVAALTAHEDDAQSADQAFHDQEETR